jgi:hypothetical protein
LFVLDQPKGDGAVEGDNIDEGVEDGRDGMQAETSVHGATATEMAGHNTEAEANILTEALATDAATALEV